MPWIRQKSGLARAQATASRWLASRSGSLGVHEPARTGDSSGTGPLSRAVKRGQATAAVRWARCWACRTPSWRALQQLFLLLGQGPPVQLFPQARGFGAVGGNRQGGTGGERGSLRGPAVGSWPFLVRHFVPSGAIQARAALASAARRQSRAGREANAPLPVWVQADSCPRGRRKRQGGWRSTARTGVSAHLPAAAGSHPLGAATLLTPVRWIVLSPYYTIRSTETVSSRQIPQERRFAEPVLAL